MTDVGLITREHALRAAQNAVRNQGYAVAVHGSWVKDLDLIAVPWRDTALDAQMVAEIIAEAIPGYIEKGSPEQKPHGRLGFTIRPLSHYGFDSWYIDLSVLPRDCDRAGGVSDSSEATCTCIYNRDWGHTPDCPKRGPGSSVTGEAVRLLAASTPAPFLVPDIVAQLPPGTSPADVFHQLRDLCDEGVLVHTAQGYVPSVTGEDADA